MATAHKMPASIVRIVQEYGGMAICQREDDFLPLCNERLPVCTSSHVPLNDVLWHPESCDGNRIGVFLEALHRDNCGSVGKLHTGERLEGRDSSEGHMCQTERLIITSTRDDIFVPLFAKWQDRESQYARLMWLDEARICNKRFELWRHCLDCWELPSHKISVIAAADELNKAVSLSDFHMDDGWEHFEFIKNYNVVCLFVQREKFECCVWRWSNNEENRCIFF